MTLSKTQLVIGLILSIAMPTATAVGSYYKSLGEIKAGYVERAELEKLRDKLDRIAEDVSEIKGILKQRRS